MSSAHRPTWDPAQARDTKGGSRQYSTRDIASHTKLKFRQAGQTSTSEVQRRDLRAELLAAEHEAKNKKRKAQGLPIEEEPERLTVADGSADEDEANKRRKLLQEVLDLDRDDDDDDVEESTAAAGERASQAGGEQDANRDERGAKDSEEENEEDDDDDDDDDEDETAELLRELEKIKRERAEEKDRQDREASAQTAEEREARVAAGNPLLNLAAALGQQTPGTPGGSASVSGSFAVKRRWDDDLVFKNQAMKEQERPGHFVNDLLRTEFHKKFMAKFIK